MSAPRLNPDRSNGWWEDHPWRLIQTNLRQIDMADMDANEYVRQLRSFDATIAMINVGGIIASYPTQLADHFQSEWLTGDSLHDVIAACHDAGIRVIARNDFSKIRRPVYENHPDWAYRTAEGCIVDYNGDVHTCLNGDYQQIVAREIIREIITTLDVDGMFFNMGGFQVRDYSYNYYGPCHCDSCRRRFREETGHELPATTDPADPVVRDYEAAKQAWVRDHESSVYRLIKEIRPDVAVDHHEFQRQESNTEIDRPLPRWQYDASSNTRWVRTSMPGTVSSNTSVDFIGFYSRHVAVNPGQQELRLWQSLANGGALDYYLIGRLDNHRDRSGFERIRKVFAFHKRNEALYRRLVSQADVLVVRPRGLTSEARGWIRVLTEGHFLFDEVLQSHLASVDLGTYACVVLPDVQGLSDEQARRIDDFVRGGGTIVATGRTGFADERLAARDRPVLAALGIEAVEMVRGDMRSALLEVQPDAYPHLPDTELLYLGDTYIYARYAEGTRARLRLIPPHRYGPPERCYFTQTTDWPGLATHELGSGKGIYLPWLPGELFYREGYVNTSSFLLDVLTGEASISPVSTNAGPMAEITVQRPAGDASFCIVSVINTSGHFATTVYDPVPMSGITVELDALKRPRSVESLRDGRPIPHEFSGGRLKLTLDVDGICETVMIDESR